jgi:hypothetical protein
MNNISLGERQLFSHRRDIVTLKFEIQCRRGSADNNFNQLDNGQMSRPGDYPGETALQTPTRILPEFNRYVPFVMLRSVRSVEHFHRGIAEFFSLIARVRNHLLTSRGL